MCDWWRLAKHMGPSVISHFIRVVNFDMQVYILVTVVVPLRQRDTRTIQPQPICIYIYTLYLTEKTAKRVRLEGRLANRSPHILVTDKFLSNFNFIDVFLLNSFARTQVLAIVSNSSPELI